MLAVSLVPAILLILDDVIYLTKINSKVAVQINAAIGKTRRRGALFAYHGLHRDWAAADDGSLAAKLGWADTLEDDPTALPEYWSSASETPRSSSLSDQENVLRAG